jgi:hypothetical protein
MSIFKAGIYALLQKKMYRRTKRYMQFKALQYKHVYNYEDSDAE